MSTSGRAGGPTYDVVVVGAGPAGALAAHTAADLGVSVLLLERAQIPRYKVCGGGLIGVSLQALPAPMRLPVRAWTDTATFTFRSRWPRTWHAPTPWLQLVNRADFDAELVRSAVSQGAVLRDGTRVTGLAEEAGVVRLDTTSGPVQAGAVVGADGSAGRLGRYVGVRAARVDVGLEVEVPWPDPDRGGWASRLLLDWGPLPGSYGWVFPKADTLTVGVIVDRRHGTAAGGYLRQLLADQRLDQAPNREALRELGHLTQVRADDSPLGRGRVLVAGDAAGLLEPFTREGISFALRSGRLAGQAAVRISQTGDTAAAALGYAEQVDRAMGAELRAGQLLYDAFARRPGSFHAAVAILPPVWRRFLQFTTGDLSWAREAMRPAPRAVLRRLSGSCRGQP